MAIGSIGSSSFAAVAAGVRAELQATVMREALETTGSMVEEHLAAALDAIEQSAQQLTSAGAEALRHEVAGAIIDVIA